MSESDNDADEEDNQSTSSDHEEQDAEVTVPEIKAAEADDEEPPLEAMEVFRRNFRQIRRWNRRREVNTLTIPVIV